MIRKISRGFISSSLTVAALVFCLNPIHAAEEAPQIVRTAYGYPDLQGYWNNLHQTPLERPRELGLKQVYSEEEAIALEISARDFERRKDQPLDPQREPPAVGTAVTNQADDDFDEVPTTVAYVNGEYRTSLIIDPPDGRISYRPDPAPNYINRLQAAGVSRSDGPEGLGLGARCLVPGPPLSLMFQRGLSPYAQIVQTRDYLMILGEYPYLPRIIRLNGEHPDPAFDQWMGDSIGHWEGDSLIVHTNNFREEQTENPFRSSEQFEVTEVFTMVERDVLLYRYTVNDPGIYTQPITAEIPLQRMAPGKVIYEYACHEGNYSLPASLAGARRQEMDAGR